MRRRSSIQIMSSGISVFFIQNGYSPLCGKKNSMPRSSARRSRYINPCVRVGSSMASSTCIAAPSGRITRGPDAAAGAGAAGVFCGALQAATRIASTMRLFLTFHLHDVARDEVVLLRVVAERAERHPQQLGRLRLHAATALERLEHEGLADRLEVVLQRDALGRQIERGDVGDRAAA